MSDAILLAIVVGLFTWGFRYLPLRARLHEASPGGPFGRFLAATGPAAIATLFVASVLPYLSVAETRILPLASGVAAVLLIYFWWKSVVFSTLAGSLAFGLASLPAAG